MVYQDAMQNVSKTEKSKRYKFTLVFMNADCEYFVDDQLTHALSSGSVPVYLGTDKTHMFLPGNLNASLNVRNFSSPRNLATYLKYLSENEHKYNKYLKRKNEGFQFPATYNSKSILQQWLSLAKFAKHNYFAVIVLETLISNMISAANVCYQRIRPNTSEKISKFRVFGSFLPQ